MDQLSRARKDLLQASASYLASDLHFELHPEDAYGDAQMELATEMLDAAVMAYVEALKTRRVG